MNKKIAVSTNKNLAVFVVMAALAMFTSVGLASANQTVPLPIRGVYDGTAECTCVIAPYGFSANLTPINNAGIVSIQNRKSTFTFEEDGTGSVTGHGSQITLAYTGPNGPVPPIPASATFSFDFVYTVTSDRSITLTPGTATLEYTAGPNKGLTGTQKGKPFTGTITPDGKVITTFSAASDLGTISGFGLPPISDNASCTCITVLTWDGNEE